MRPCNGNAGGMGKDVQRPAKWKGITSAFAHLRVSILTSPVQPSSGTQQPPRAFAALRAPGFAPYLVGSMLAMMADSIEHVISWWMMFEKFHSPALGGYAVISHWLPFLLFSLHAGMLAERFDPSRLIHDPVVLHVLCSMACG